MFYEKPVVGGKKCFDKLFISALYEDRSLDIQIPPLQQ